MSTGVSWHSSKADKFEKARWCCTCRRPGHLQERPYAWHWARVANIASPELLVRLDRPAQGGEAAERSASGSGLPLLDSSWRLHALNDTSVHPRHMCVTLSLTNVMIMGCKDESTTCRQTKMTGVTAWLISVIINAHQRCTEHDIRQPSVSVHPHWLAWHSVYISMM